MASVSSFTESSSFNTKIVPQSIFGELVGIHSRFAEDELLEEWRKSVLSVPAQEQRIQLEEFFGNIRKDDYGKIGKQDYAIFLRRLNILLEVLNLNGIRFYPEKNDSREKDVICIFREHRNAASHCFDSPELQMEPNSWKKSNVVSKERGRLAWAKAHPPCDILQKLLSMEIPDDSYLWSFLFSKFRSDDYALATDDCANICKEVIYLSKEPIPGVDTTGWLKSFEEQDPKFFQEQNAKKMKLQIKTGKRFKLTEHKQQGFEDKPGHLLWLYHNIYKCHYDVPPHNTPLHTWNEGQWKDLLNIPLDRFDHFLRMDASRTIHTLWSQELWNTWKEKLVSEHTLYISALQEDLNNSAQIFFAYAKEWQKFYGH